MSYLEFTSIVRGKIFFNKLGQQVFNYELFWSEVNPYALLSGKAKYRVENRS